MVASAPFTASTGRGEPARQRKDYAAADSLRQQLLAAGVAVKDTPEGSQWYYVREGDDEQA